MPDENCLLLGMVDADEYRLKRGQEGRDKTRVDAMRSRFPNTIVYTLDDKHAEVQVRWERVKSSLRRIETPLPFHIQANINDSRRLFTTIKSKIGFSKRFKLVILDYFFSPVMP